MSGEMDRRSFLRNSLATTIGASSVIKGGLAQADDCTGLAPAEHLFRATSITLKGMPTSDAAQLTVGASGHVYVIVKNPVSEVRQFDPAGRLVRRFGEYGRADGQFVVPISICCDVSERLYVLDVSLGRIQVFQQNGLCERRISLIEQNVQASQVACCMPGTLYVGSVARSRTDSLAHRIDLNGRLLSSFYATDPRIQKFNLWAVASGMLAVGRDGSVYAAQQVSSAASKFSPGGAHLVDIGSRPPCYHDPVALPDPYPRDHLQLEKILRQFTRLDNVLLFRENTLALSFRLAGDTPRWVLQMYGPAGQAKGGPVLFTVRPAASDRDRFLYCRTPPAVGNQGMDLGLQVYSIFGA